MLSSALAAAQSIENWNLTSSNAIGLLASLGSYLSETGWYSRAEEILRHAYRLLSEFGEPDPTAEIFVSRALANVYYEQGRYEEAKRLYNRVLTLQEEDIGSNDPELTDTLFALEQIELLNESYPAAESLLMRSLEIQRAAEVRNPRPLMKTLNGLGDLFLAQERYEDAEKAFRQALELEGADGALDGVSWALNGLGKLYLSQEKFTEAKRAYEQLKEVSSASQNKGAYARSLVGLAQLNLKQKSYPRAKVFLQESLQALKDAGGSDLLIADALDLLASVRLMDGDFAEAEDDVRRALQIKESLLGPGHPEMADSFRIYAQILRKTGRTELADEIESRAERVSSLRSG